MQVLADVCRPLQFTGKARILGLFAGKRGIKDTRIFGSVFNLDLEDFIQRSIYWGTFEPAETRLVRKHLRRGMTFVDVGANVGYYTALAAKYVGPTGHVVSFEPSVYAFDKLRAMVSSNRLETVTVLNAGLSSTTGQAKLYMGAGFHNHSPTMVPHGRGYVPNGSGNVTATDVAIVTLDDEAERLGLTRIDLIKIDVEGHEPHVLAGAKRLLKERRIRAILCEFNEAWLRSAGSSPGDLEATIADAGFVCRAGSGRENRFFTLSSDC